MNETMHDITKFHDILRFYFLNSNCLIRNMAFSTPAYSVILPLLFLTFPTCIEPLKVHILNCKFILMFKIQNYYLKSIPNIFICIEPTVYRTYSGARRGRVLDA